MHAIVLVERAAACYKDHDRPELALEELGALACARVAEGGIAWSDNSALRVLYDLFYDRVVDKVFLIREET